MLYIIDIDENSFGISYSSTGTQEVRPKMYHAVSIAPIGSAENGLVTIRHNDEGRGNLISLKEPSELSIDGTVYADADNAAAAINAFMANDTFTLPTTTTTPA